MAYIKGGTSLALVDVGSATKAARTEFRPTDVGALGSYQIDVSQAMSAGIGGPSVVFSCRWGDATRTMLVRRLAIYAKCSGTAFTAGAIVFDAIIARAFSASDTGGVSVLPTGHSQKKRTSFGTTLISDLRIASTAALGAGTRTLDAQPVAAIRGHLPATNVNYVFIGDNISPYVPGASTVAGAVAPKNLFAPDWGGEWPMVFVQNEGFVIRATVPATGTWDFAVQMEWSEVLSTAGFN